MNRTLKIFAVIAIGSAISYLLWFSYFGLLPPKLLTAGVAHKYSQSFIAMLGNHMSRESAVLAAYVFIRALPGALVVGILFGIALLYVRQKLLFCLSIFTWPLVICARYFDAFCQFGFGSADYQGYFKTEMSTALAFYSLFFLVAFAVFAIATFVTHNPSFHRTLRDKAAHRR